MRDAKKMKSEASTSGGFGRNTGGAESVIVDVGRRKSSCGYCKSGARTSICHGLWAHSLAVDDYQALLDRGWRRSGCFLYKPEMKKTCCPSYTIRLKANDFIPSKEQIRISKRMRRFLDGSLESKKSNELLNELEPSEGLCSNTPNFSTSAIAIESGAVDYDGKDIAETFVHSLSDQIDDAVQTCMKNGEFASNIQFPKASVKTVAPSKRKLHAEISEKLIFSSNIAFQIAATVKQSRKDGANMKAIEQNGLEINKVRPELSPKMIGDMLASHLKQPAESYGFSVRACNGHINFYSAMEHICNDEELERASASKPLSTASGCTDRHKKKSSGDPQGKKPSFKTELKRSSFDYEEYSLYRKYQLRVHNDTPDQVSETSYKTFLVDTPLVHIPPIDDFSTPPCGFGSFHQQYLIDGKLVAVGVIDILPKCLSSKYLFWDPDLAFLSLGKFSALEEIKWINENQMHCPSLQHYYLGYYIHSCEKMRYKAAYRPSELLCPLRYQWVPYDFAKPFLDTRKYVVFSDLDALENEESLPPVVLGNIMEEQPKNITKKTSNDAFVNEEEMAELDSEDSDYDSDSEVNTIKVEDSNLNNVLIGLNGAPLRYKTPELMTNFGHHTRKHQTAQNF